MRFSLMRLCHRTPGFKWIGRALPRAWFFKRTQWNIAVLVRLFGYRRNEIAAMRQTLSALQIKDLDVVAEKYLVCRRWRRNLIDAWPNWVERLEEWCALEGEEHLAEAVERGRGAVLLSGHDYGFCQFVAPALAQRGYKVFRGGLGRDPQRRAERWGEGRFRRWEYLNYYGSPYHRLRVLNRMRTAVEENGVVYLDVTGSPRGEPRLEIPFWHGRFFLNASLFRLIEILRAPVLPCFAICDAVGRVVIKIYPALEPVTEIVSATFGPLYAEYLRERPEFSPIWKKVALQKEEF